MTRETRSLSEAATLLAGKPMTEAMLKPYFSSLTSREVTILQLYYDKHLSVKDISLQLNITCPLVIDARQYAEIKLLGAAGITHFHSGTAYKFPLFMQYSDTLCNNKALQDIVPYLPRKTGLILDYMYLQNRDLYDVCLAGAMTPREARTLLGNVEYRAIKALRDTDFKTKNKLRNIDLTTEFNAKFGTSYTNAEVQQALAALTPRHQDIYYSYYIEHKTHYGIRGIDVTLETGLDVLMNDINAQLSGTLTNKSLSILNWIVRQKVGHFGTANQWQKALDFIAPQSRRVLLLSVIENKSFEEIGKMLDVTKQRVSQLRKRALDQIYRIALAWSPIEDTKS